MKSLLKYPQWFGPIVIIGAWIVAHQAGIFNPVLLPGFFDTVRHLAYILYSGNILADFNQSMLRMTLGFLIAVIVGIPLGIAMGFFSSVYRIFEIPLDFFRSLPVTTLYPLFVLIFGIGHQSKIAMVTAATIFVIIFNTATGVLQRKVIRTQVAQLFGASKLQVLKEVVFWEALPSIIVGLRIAVSYALIVEIVCEMFMGAQKGLGQRVFEAYNTYLIIELYAIILLVGLTGYFINQIFVFLGEKVIHWVGK